MQEKTLGQFALQADEGFVGVGDGGVRQDDDEFLAAEAGDGVLRTQGFADGGRQVDQRGVAGFVSQGVVEFLEVVDIQQGNAERRFAPLRTREFVVERFFQAAPVQHAGQLIVTHERAGFVEFVLQFVDALFGGFDLLPGCAQIVARTLGVELDDARGADDFGEHIFQLGDVVGLADFFHALFHLVVVVGRRVRELGEVVDESRQHLLERLLGFDQTVLELALFENDLFQTAFRFVDCPDVDGPRNDLAHHGNLAVEPAVVDNQFADVVDHQLQQLEQAGAQFFAVFRQELESIGKTLDGGKQVLRGLQAGCAADHGHQVARFRREFRVVRQLADDGGFHGEGKSVAQFRQHFAGTADGD